MDVSLYLEGQNGLTWGRWKRFVAVVERLGFSGMFRSDHFTGPIPPDKPSLELIVSLTYLADHTQHIHFGSLVAPLSLRDPVMLARQAAALDDLSDGRMILGVGAGWQAREHTLFGYELGDAARRMARLQEGLEVISRLLRSAEPVTFEGHLYQLHEAALLPRPQRAGGPRILVGGNTVKHILPLVARYADVWNALALSPGAFRERSRILDTLLLAEGRRPADVKRTLASSLNIGRSMQELDGRLQWRLRVPELTNLPLHEVIEIMSTKKHAFIGTPAMVLAQMQRYAEAGVEEIMLQWWNMDDIESLELFAEEVLPKIEATE